MRTSIKQQHTGTTTKRGHTGTTVKIERESKLTNNCIQKDSGKPKSKDGFQEAAVKCERSQNHSASF